MVSLSHNEFTIAVSLPPCFYEQTITEYHNTYLVLDRKQYPESKKILGSKVWAIHQV